MKIEAISANFWLIQANGQTLGLSRTITACGAFIACDCGYYGDGTPCKHGAAIERHIEAINGNSVEVNEVRFPKQRCAHYGQIREFFAVAREFGFDTSKASQDRWRGAIGMLLGRAVQSRSELTGAEWGFCTNALRMGKLFI